ncbi:GPW/gp25 family protein [Arcticibacter svalbardensis MN12-7]|uniref:GPW/gp25 family protein n=1 Tax=Arcticibacter svalbardensis MN12-7 TaxID=1150600 RepID=R9GS00_9SPHI|nr:GPW/gp25 family protein [Arcticibacter svalbardensis]EOR94501.1 GPW/gp25 family protein [Arcticibacter svalbardensis MN12-7]
MDRSKDVSELSFLGRGWSFPPTFSKKTNEVLMTSDEEDINKSLEILLSTTIGERFLQPLYGCNLENYVFEAMSASTETQIKITVKNAILMFEPRIKLLVVTLLDDFITEGRIDISVNYEVINTNTRYNLVYPFYLNEANNKSA